MRRTHLGAWLVLGGLWLASCGTGNTQSVDGLPEPGEDVAGDVAEDTGYQPPPDITKPDYGDVATTPEQQELLQWHAALVDESTDMTTQQLMDKFYQQRPYVEQLSYTPGDAEFMDLISEKLSVTDGELQALDKSGFVILDRVRYPSHPMGYRDLFVEHIPVLITTDSILFAMHKSYDMMLRKFEENVLIGAMDKILDNAHSALVELKDVSQDPVYQAALSDVDLFYTVARSLLNGELAAPMFAANEAVRDELLGQIEALEPRLIELFGRDYPCAGPGCAFDFSQFKPRGHYTLSEELKQYFKAMIWMGRTEIVLTRYHREFLVSEIMRRSLEQSQGMTAWSGVDQVIQAFVGKSDNMTPVQLGSFMQQQESPELDALVDPEKAQVLMDALEASELGDQRILSQIIAVNPMNTEPTLLPPIFLFMGQRFVIDSYVFSNVVFDRIYYNGQPQFRYMPSPLDAMFVLGYQEALPHLEGELNTYHYAGNLNVLRQMVDAYGPDFWAESMYNVWLDGIRALTGDFTDVKYPEAVRTKAYAHKLMNTGLASWAELRHDTILYVKQSYTGVACDYPDGYVEPFPEFFKKIAAYAKTSRELMAALPAQMKTLDYSMSAYFTNLETVANTLAAIAEKQLAQEPRLPEQTEFIKTLVQDESMCGSAPFSGWYKELFFDATDTTFDFEPTIADVHTDPNSTDILHVGTGYANPLILTVKTTCGLRAYVGPASSYYEHRETGFTRLTDEEWKGRLEGNLIPPRPSWTTSFIVD